MQPLDGRPIVVVGAGIAGLAAAHRLCAAGARVTVLEKRPHVAGRMYTEAVNDIRIDTGAGFLANFFDHTRALLKDVAMDHDLVLVEGSGATLRDGRWRRIRPWSTGADPRLLSAKSFLYLPRIIIPLLKHWHRLDWHAFWRLDSLDTGSATEYAQRYLNEELLEYLIRPALESMFYAPPERTSQAILFVLLKAAIGLERYKLRDGLGSLPDALVAGLDVRCETEVIRITGGPRRGYRVNMRYNDEERMMDADGIVCATEASAVPRLFPGLSTAQRSFFESVEYSSTVIVALALRTRPLEGRPDALIPRSEAPNSQLLAVTSLAAKNPLQVPAGCDVLRLYSTGKSASALLELDDAAVRDALVSDLENVAGIRPGKDDEMFYRVYRWPLAVPLFEVGYIRRLRTFIESSSVSDRLAFAGDYLGGPFIEGAVTSRLEAAGRLVETWTGRSPSAHDQDA